MYETRAVVVIVRIIIAAGLEVRVFVYEALKYSRNSLFRLDVATNNFPSNEKTLTTKRIGYTREI